MRRAFLVLIVLAVMLCLGCTTTNPIPPGCESSVILKQIPNAKEVDLLLKLANVQAVKQNLYTKSEALAAIESIETVLLEKNITYADLAGQVLRYVDGANQRAGIEIFLIVDYIQGFKSEVVQIDKCDRDLLLKHLQQQRTYVGLLE